MFCLTVCIYVLQVFFFSICMLTYIYVLYICTSLVIGGTKKKELRGWFRKFCHRCYNFVNIHDRLLYYTLIERATFFLYNDAKTMHERNKYFEIHALKDTWGKTTGTFS